MKPSIFFIVWLLLAPIGTIVAEEDDHNHSHGEAPQDTHSHNTDALEGARHEDDQNGHSEHDEHKTPATSIPPEAAKDAGLNTAVAASQLIEQTTKVYGRISIPPHQLSHIQARFPGMIMKVNANVGDDVKKGDLLASIESNVSLHNYPIRSPISGKVLKRHANAGESTQEQELFSIANLNELWAELKIFPSQRNGVFTKSTVYLHSGNSTQTNQIIHLTPSPENQPYFVARAPIDNTDHSWIVGQSVEGSIVVASEHVPLAVSNSAIQHINGKPVIFIKRYDTYTAHPVETGISDNNWTQILSGIETGEEYVSENSYLIKADIEKSAAAHDHSH